MATFKTGWMKKMIDNVSTRIFAISHVKSTYYDYAGGTTLDEVLIETEDSDQEAPEENEISPAILSKLNETNSEVDALKEEVDELKEGAISLANNLTTTEEGYALDARQGKALNDKLGSTDISTIGDGTVTNAISTLNSNLEYEPVGSTDVNTLLTPGKYFVMNGINLPQTELDVEHGFLDVIYYNGAMFNPDGQGLYPVIKQIYQSYYTNTCYTRTYMTRKEAWSEWKTF